MVGAHRHQDTARVHVKMAGNLQEVYSLGAFYMHLRDRHPNFLGAEASRIRYGVEGLRQPPS